MDQTDKYLNFIRNYNQALKDKKTNWLKPNDMGDVLLRTAAQNSKGQSNKSEKVSCMYYKHFDECTLNNDSDDPGDCVYENGIEPETPAIKCKYHETSERMISVTEQKCKEFIKNYLQNADARCKEMLEEMDEYDLNDIDMQLDRILRTLENAKMQLKNCEDY